MKQILNWNGGWTFSKDPEKRFDPAVPFGGAPVTLPHTWYTDEDPYQGDAVYEKIFSLRTAADQHVFLRFDGVDKECEIYLNGKSIGGHQGGYTRFAVELTEALTEGENRLNVRVNNEKGETVSPLSGDFTLFGGIYRKAEMWVTEDAWFDPTYFGTEGVIFRTAIREDGTGAITAEPHIGGKAEGLRIRCTLTDPDGKTAAQTEGPAGEILRMEITAPRRWNGLQDPALYTAGAALYRDGKLLDEVCLRVGFRSIGLDPEKGFFLNGAHLKLHGVAKHQDTAGVFSATTAEHWKQDMAIVREIGANTIRLSHYPHAQGVYDLCDEMGLVVWAEIPMLKMTSNPALLENTKKQLQEMILQNMHHPGICFWGVQNEIGIFGQKPWMPDGVRALNDLAHELDSDRFTASANENSTLPDSELEGITDAQTHNVYYGWYYGKMQDHADFLDEFHRINPEVPLGISEYGVDCNPVFHSETPKVNDYTEEYQALYHETVYPYMAERDFVWGSYIWNMFDFVSAIRNAGGVKARNIKGLVTHDRQTRKDAFYYYKAQWSTEPFVHIAGKRFANRTGETMTVKAYSNLKELTLRSGELTETRRSDTGVFRFENVPIRPEGSKVTVSGGNREDRAVFTRVEEADSRYIFVDTNAGLNVRNWFVDEQEEARMFPEDAYSLRNKMEDLAANPQVMAVIDRMTPKLGPAVRDEDHGMFTLEAALRYQKPDYTEEEIKALNEALTRIPRT